MYNLIFDVFIGIPVSFISLSDLKSLQLEIDIPTASHDLYRFTAVSFVFPPFLQQAKCCKFSRVQFNGVKTNAVKAWGQVVVLSNQSERLCVYLFLEKETIITG